MDESLIQFLNTMIISYFIISFAFSAYFAYMFNQIVKNPPEDELEKMGINSFILNQFINVYSSIDIFLKLFLLLFFGLSWPYFILRTKFE